MNDSKEKSLFQVIVLDVAKLVGKGRPEILSWVRLRMMRAQHPRGSRVFAYTGGQITYTQTNGLCPMHSLPLPQVLWTSQLRPHPI